MGIRERWRELWAKPPMDIEPARKLELVTGFNVRELGGYEVDRGATRWRRFVRSGSLDMLSAQDQQRLARYGVRLVLDLRGDHEVSAAPDHLSHMPRTRYRHVPLFDLDISDPKLDRGGDEGGYMTLGYLTMLGNHEAVRDIFSFFATAEGDECVLFHCAAGMDRTGMTAMLLLGLAGASRERIMADYCYSFGSVAEVDRFVYGGGEPLRHELRLRREAIGTVYDRLLDGYGSFEDYLLSCGITREELSRVRSRLLIA